MTFEELAGENLEYSIDDWENCQVIEEKIISFDGEKGYVEKKCIVQHKETSKYYSFTYTDWGRGEYEGFEDLTEVFPKTKTITYYE